MKTMTDRRARIARVLEAVWDSPTDRDPFEEMADALLAAGVGADHDACLLQLEHVERQLAAQTQVVEQRDQMLATARERVRELENENAALRPSAENYHRQRIAKEQAEARERAVTKLLALHEECDDDIPCSILSDLRALLAPPAPAP